jgi:hypothetical protein
VYGGTAADAGCRLQLARTCAGWVEIAKPGAYGLAFDDRSERCIVVAAAARSPGRG